MAISPVWFVAAAILCSFLSTTDAFATLQRRTTLQPLASSRIPQNNDNNSDDGGEYQGDIDWDGEWKKVVAQQTTTNDRPQGNYKSDAEIAAIRAANQATESVTKAAAEIPTFAQLKGDWKFWIGLLAIISIGTSLLAGSGISGGGGTPVIGSPDSYYI